MSEGAGHYYVEERPPRDGYQHLTLRQEDNKHDLLYITIVFPGPDSRVGSIRMNTIQTDSEELAALYAAAVTRAVEILHEQREGK